MTIREIAKLSGVSIATVSRCLNYPEKVKASTRKKVLGIIESTNYKPNYIARGLSTNKTNTIAVIVPDLTYSPFSETLSGIEKISKQNNLSMIISNTSYDKSAELDSLKIMISKQVDGVIAIIPSSSHETITFLNSSEKPYVVIGPPNSNTQGFTCSVDYFQVTKRLHQHISQLSLKKALLLLDSKEVEINHEIIEGFSRVNENDEVNYDFTKSNNSVTGGFLELEKRIRNKTFSKYDVVVTYSYLQAFGVLKSFKNNCIKCPDDCALICLEDTPLNTAVSPEITSVYIPYPRLGIIATRLLVDIMNKEEVLNKHFLLEPLLKIRQSCGNQKLIYEFHD